MRVFLKDDELADRIEAGWQSAHLDPRRGAMLAFAVKLTAEPRSMSEEDIQSLRAVGFDDADILHITQVASYFNFVNRMAEGLGVELESDKTRRPV